MHDSQDNRAALEKAILTASKSIHEDENSKCLDSQSVEEFLQAWFKLVIYYERNSYFAMGVEVVREYLDWVNRFSTVWHDEHRSSDCHEMAQEACEELELFMVEIIKAVEQRIYPTGR